MPPARRLVVLLSVPFLFVLSGVSAENNGLVSDSRHESDRDEFSRRRTPTEASFNGSSCADCHHHPSVGGGSVVTVLRSGSNIVHARGIREDFGRGPPDLRVSTPLYGLGYVECVSDADLSAVRDAQPKTVRGEVAWASVDDGTERVGRFGWKCQHASLTAFCAQAYKDELGIDDDRGSEAFARFVRSLEPPEPGPQDATGCVRGYRLFLSLGCGVCHVESLTTASAGTKVGTFTVPEVLGGRTIRPYSDYLLHDLGNGKWRTSPLWGLRHRSRMTHDGTAYTFDDVMKRHGGQGKSAASSYDELGAAGRADLTAFLLSL